MTKKIIAIISVLKPVDDTRNFEKVAVSLGNTNKYDINIIGFSTKVLPTHPNIKCFPIFNFKRNSLKRLASPFKIWKILLKLKPELIISNTAEILPVIIAYQIIFGAKIVYDIQENYFRNILYTSSFPIPFRLPLAIMVRAAEIASTPFFSKFILAEKVYQKQLNFLPKPKTTIMENKAIIPDFIMKMRPEANQKMIFIYAGTIAEHYGIFDAIEFIKALKIHETNIELRIVGFAADPGSHHRVLQAINNIDYITMIGGDSLVPHHQVLIEMKRADYCLLPYQKNKSTLGRIPTKLYECLAMKIPVIITQNQTCNELITKNDAGVIHDFRKDLRDILPQLHNTFYKNDPDENYYWSENESKLIQLIDDTFS